METRVVLGTVAVIGLGAVAVVALPGLPWWSWPVGTAGAAGLALAARCSHREVTLLPPVAGGGPDRNHARWYCDRCGRTWAAGLRTSARPERRFDGFDQAKAERSAARADVLERQRRRLALERAGLGTRAPRKPRAIRPGPRKVAPAAPTATAIGEKGAARLTFGRR